MLTPDWKVFSTYLEDVPHVKPRSWHKTVLNRFASFYKDRKLSTVEDLGAYFRYNKEEYDLINATLNCHLKIIRHICNKLGSPYKEIVKEFKRFPEEEPIIIPLTEQEVNALIEQGYEISKKAGLLIELLCRTGMRNETELCQLKWSDLVDDTIIIRKSKNNRSNVLPLYGFSRKLLEYKEITDFKLGYMFEGYYGNIKYDTVNKYLQQAAKQAGITKYVHAHLIRHTVGTLLADNDVNLKKIGNWLNQKSITSTARYIHLSMKSKEATGRMLPLMACSLVDRDIVAILEKAYHQIENVPNSKEFINNDEEIYIRIKKHL
jgi:integrase/recombinase XerD